MIVVQLHRQIFRQMQQNSVRVVVPTRRNFVKYDGKDASKCATKAIAVHCAVLP